MDSKTFDEANSKGVNIHGCLGLSVGIDEKLGKGEGEACNTNDRKNTDHKKWDITSVKSYK